LEADVSALIRTEKAALRLIARAEQCSQGLARKLEKRGHDEACIAEVISGLSEKKLIDDGRYAQLWLESRLHFTRSPRRLLSSLCARGIERDNAETALKAALDEDAELALLLRYVKKHSRKTGRADTGQNSGENERQLRFLLRSEGFSPQVITRFFDDE
jgi:regulatory protein